MGGIVRNCRLCKKPMETSPFMLCSTCLIESDKVRSFIIKHPYVSIEQISLETNVPYVKVKKMVNSGFNRKSEKEKEIL